MCWRAEGERQVGGMLQSSGNPTAPHSTRTTSGLLTTDGGRTKAIISLRPFLEKTLAFLVLLTGILTEQKCTNKKDRNITCSHYNFPAGTTFCSAVPLRIHLCSPGASGLTTVAPRFTRVMLGVANIPSQFFSCLGHLLHYAFLHQSCL